MQKRKRSKTLLLHIPHYQITLNLFLWIQMAHLEIEMLDETLEPLERVFKSSPGPSRASTSEPGPSHTSPRLLLSLNFFNFFELLFLYEILKLVKFRPPL